MNAQSPVKIWRNQQRIAMLFGKTGTVLSWTIVRVPPAGFAEAAPYPVVVVKLDDGTQITAQLVDVPFHDRESDFTGMKVRTVIRRVRQPDADGVIPYGIKVKPL